MSKQKATIITGVAGTTGSSVLDLYMNDPEVVSGERTVIGYDNFFRGVFENIEDHKDNPQFIFRGKNFQSIYEDPEEKEFLSKFDIDIVIHMAAVVPTKYFYKDPCLTFDENCKGTIDLFNHMKGIYGISTFISGSTSEVYGHPSSFPIHEEDMSHFDSVDTTTRWSYAEGKILTEHVLNQFSDQVRVCHLRFANTYGSRDMDDNHIIPYLVNRFIDNEDIIVNKSPEEFYRTFLNEKDAAEAVISVLKSGKTGTAYNVGSPHEFTIYELIYLIKNLVMGCTGEEYTGRIRYEIDRPGDPKRRVLCVDRIRRDTGFEPKIDLSSGVIEMIMKRRREYR